MRMSGVPLSLTRALTSCIAAATPGVSTPVDRLIGIAMAGVPIACSMSLASDVPMGYTRTAPKAGYGEHSLLETELADGERVFLVDDIVTSMDTKIAAQDVVLRRAKADGLGRVECDGVAVVVDREQHAGYQGDLRIHSLVRLRSEGLDWLTNAAEPWEIELVRAYLDDPSSFQDEASRRGLLNELVP